MLAKIIYYAGIVAAIWCVVDIFTKSRLDLIWKIILTIAVLATSWIGILVYYFIIRGKI